MKTYPNGRVPADELTPIPGGRLRRGAPAKSWLALRYFLGKRYGVWIVPTGPMSSYRSLEQQRILWQRYTTGQGALAARPGTSNHGSGIPGRAAVDLPTARMQQLMRRHGNEFGWSIAGAGWTDAPSEPWHAVTNSTRLTWKARIYWNRRKLAGKKKR
jgi:hypothetical protein